MNAVRLGFNLFRYIKEEQERKVFFTLGLMQIGDSKKSLSLFSMFQAKISEIERQRKLEKDKNSMHIISPCETSDESDFEENENLYVMRKFVLFVHSVNVFYTSFKIK